MLPNKYDYACGARAHAGTDEGKAIFRIGGCAGSSPSKSSILLKAYYKGTRCLQCASTGAACSRPIIVRESGFTEFMYILFLSFHLNEIVLGGSFSSLHPSSTRCETRYVM